MSAEGTRDPATARPAHKHRAIAAVLALWAGFAAASDPPPEECPAGVPHLRILGSGGPETADRRASSAYLVHDGERYRALVDAGGGSALRFGQAGARVEMLDVVLFTHLHADHTSDFPALVKASYFERRQAPLPVAGPAAGGDYPSTPEFVEAILGEAGAWRYLSGHLTPGSGDYVIEPQSLGGPSSAPASTAGAGPLLDAAQLDRPGFDLTASRVAHGPVPALAWRVNMDGLSVTFSGDTNGNGDALARLAEGTDLLVAHHAVPEGATGVARRLHMPPSRIGQIAADAGVAHLVLSHHMTRTLGREAESLAAIRAAYAGPVSFARDLDCFTARLPEHR